MTRKTALILTVIITLMLSTRGFAGAGERFIDNGDGTITDHQLKLMWARTDNQGDMDWKQADQWVRLTFPFILNKTYDNWRLPTVDELKSLYIPDKSYKGYKTICGLRVKITPMIQLTCAWVWTADRDQTAPTARVYNFNLGYHYTDRLVHKRAHRALPVRSIK